MKAANRHIITAVILVLSVMAAVAFAAEGNGKLKVQIPPDPQLYSKAPQPLTVEQCAQCHPSVFQNIKEDGGKHRFDCQKCHSAFHVYNPKKGNYDAIMPKCDTCHDQPHGAKVTDCSKLSLKSPYPQESGDECHIGKCLQPVPSRPAGTIGQVPEQALQGRVQSLSYGPWADTILFQLPQAASCRSGNRNLHQVPSCPQTFAGNLSG